MLCIFNYKAVCLNAFLIYTRDDQRGAANFHMPINRFLNSTNLSSQRFVYFPINHFHLLFKFTTTRSYAVSFIVGTAVAAAVIRLRPVSVRRMATGE